MNKKEVGALDTKTDRARIAWVLENLKSTSLTGRARIYVDFLKDGYIFKPLETRHEEMLDNFTEDKTSAFVEMMLNSSRPVSAYDTLLRVAPKDEELSDKQRGIDSKTALVATLAQQRCSCTPQRQVDEYCLFRKMSFWENRKIQKELSRRGIL